MEPATRPVTVSPEVYAAVEKIVLIADELCTAVIAGKTHGLMRLALDLARALDALKRRGVSFRHPKT